MLPIWNHKTDLARVLRAMSAPHTFYVLGAGASYGLVPTTNQMKAVIRKEYSNFGIYPAYPSSFSALHERVIGWARRESANFEELLSEELLYHIPRGALVLLVQKALYRPIGPIPPPQYAVFDVVASPATLVNFNLDGLAAAFCNHRHSVIEPHGRIDRVLLEDDRFKSCCEDANEFDVPVHHITPKLLPSPEPFDISSGSTYERARHLFRRSSAMLIIGYSFGRTGTSFDDSISWQFFIDLLKLWPRPVFVLSPFPEEIAELLRQGLSSNRVFGLPVYWENLAECLIAAASPNRKLPQVWSDTRLSDLMCQYERAVGIRWG